VQPFTVIVLAELEIEPGPPEVEDELETLPPPACTCTEDPPAELLREMPLLPLVEDEPAAAMLPSLRFSTVTEQVSPDAVLPVLTTVSA